MKAKTGGHMAPVGALRRSFLLIAIRSKSMVSMVSTVYLQYALYSVSVQVRIQNKYRQGHRQGTFRNIKRKGFL